MNTRSSSRSIRSAFLLLAAFAAIATVGAGSASAAATLSVTTDTNQVRQDAAVTITTALSGSGTATKQYGAKIALPAALPLSYYNTDAGTGARCTSAGAFSSGSTSLGSVVTFNNANCPSTSVIGTAQIGSLSGKIYAVSTSPLTRLGVYFDQGTSSPFGREISTTWNNGAVTLGIVGLPNTSTSGLTLTFSNPNRGSGLATKVFTWVEPGDSGCMANPQATAQVFNWPLFVFPGFSTYSTTTATPANLTLTGCEYDFYSLANGASQPYDDAPVFTQAKLFTPGDRQYGQVIDFPSNLWWSYPAISNTCSSSSYSTVSTGYTPATQAFTPVGCSAASVVGTATLGSQSGKIYVVSASPVPAFGVYFDQGVTTPYGRRLSVDFPTDSNYVSHARFIIMGLQGAANAGLKLNWTPPAGNEYVWYLAPGGTAECGTAYATSKIYTYPASGTAATATATLTARNPIVETGC